MSVSICLDLSGSEEFGQAISRFDNAMRETYWGAVGFVGAIRESGCGAVGACTNRLSTGQHFC